MLILEFSRWQPAPLAPIALAVALLSSSIAACGAAEPGKRRPPEGFAALFNGENLEGWKGGETVDPQTITAEQQAKWDSEVPVHWHVDEDEIVSDGTSPHLVTVKEYGDFEMWVDWKIGPKGDSGIYLRGCPQVQIWDPEDESVKQYGADKGSGALWNNERHERFPSELADRPTGEWNRMYIRLVGEYATVVLNDKTVVKDVVMENYYDRQKPLPARGRIHLQTHGSETRFRNLFVREIPSDEANRILSEIRGGETGFTPLFNGRDLVGWKGAVDEYEVRGGALQIKPRHHGNLVTDRKYDNFVLRLEFKLPPGGNSGLAVRVPDANVPASLEGLEIQILDDRDPQYADLHDYQAHGSVYGLKGAYRGYLRPLHEWNFQEVVLDGNHIEVHVNGVKTLDADLAEIRDKPVDGAEHPGAERESGYLGFCGHDDSVAFRNIRIKSLSQSKP
jgi:hypothetical protein